MSKFQTNTGVKVIINPAPFGTVKELRKCFLRQLRKQNIEIGNPKSLSELTNTISKDFSKYLNLFKNYLIDLELDDEFEKLMNECLSYCTYKDMEINEALFERHREALEEYDKIRFECIKENLKPFFKNPLGLLKSLDNSNENVQE